MIVNHMNKGNILFVAIIFFFSITLNVNAQDVKETKLKDGYGYRFEDDPLAAEGFGPNDTQIRVRESAARATLIRPRTSFIVELLKSVENL